MRSWFLLLACLVLAPWSALGDARLILASTTSTDNSGLFQHLLPQFTEQTGNTVHVIAVGTGQALKLGRNGDADILLVHHPESEKRFVAEGFGTRRLKVMYNDFVIVGPRADPAGLNAAPNAVDAMGRIARAGVLFTSRGDESGTHKAELNLWAAAGQTPNAAEDRWYREMGAGMGATLNAAVALEAYALTDRATWLSFDNRKGHRIVFHGDPALFNQYALIPVSPVRHAHVNAVGAARLAAWLLSKEGQAAIAAFRLRGQQVFFPNAD